MRYMYSCIFRLLRIEWLLNNYRDVWMCSAEAFFDERIAGFLPGEKPPKMQFWRLILSIRYHMIRSIPFAKYKEGTHCTKYNSARNCIFGHLHTP